MVEAVVTTRHPLWALIEDLIKPQCPHCQTKMSDSAWVSIAKVTDLDIISSWLCPSCGMYFSVEAEFISSPHSAPEPL